MDLMQTGTTTATIAIVLRAIVVFEFIVSISPLFDYKYNVIYSTNVPTIINNIDLDFAYARIFIIVSDSSTIVVYRQEHPELKSIIVIR